MLTKSQKIKLVEELADILKNNASILFVDFSALNMGEIIALKKDLKKEGIKFKALKKSLLTFAFLFLLEKPFYFMIQRHLQLEQNNTSLK